MPCRTDPLSNKEEETILVRDHILYVLAKYKEIVADIRSLKFVTNTPDLKLVGMGYGGRADELTAYLCSLITKIKNGEPIGIFNSSLANPPSLDHIFDMIVYNARDKSSRALADWWERHEEWDKERREKEMVELSKTLEEILEKSSLDPESQKKIKKIWYDDEK